MRELPQGTVTLLFTDIEGSTRLLGRAGPLVDEDHAVFLAAQDRGRTLDIWDGSRDRARRKTDFSLAVVAAMRR